MVLAPLLFLGACASLPEAASPLGEGDPPAAPADVPGPPPALPEQAGAPAPAGALAGEGFVLLAEERGVKVYRREKRPGVELAAEGSFAATPDRVRRVLLDYPNHRRWQKHLKENRVLRRGDGFLDVYERLDLPVLDDRDFTLHVTWGGDSDVPWMRFVAANEHGPAPVRGVVRVTAHEGGWRLEPVSGGAGTHAVYRFYLDLAGSFPAWMGKGAAASDVPELFANITQQLPGYP
jgi:Polyketide cyclase / dehydrase and lipid transport